MALPFSDMFTPGELKADITTLTTRVRALDLDISAHQPGTPDGELFHQQWAAWFNEYSGWAGSLNVLDYTLNATRDKARAYSDTLGQWIQTWIKAGGKVASLAAVMPPSKDIGARGRGPDGGFNFSSLIAPLLIGGGIVAAVVIFKK